MLDMFNQKDMKILDSQVKQGKTEGHHTKTYWNAYKLTAFIKKTWPPPILLENPPSAFTMPLSSGSAVM